MKFYQYFVVLFVLLECQLKKKMNKFYDIMSVSSVAIQTKILFKIIHV